MGVTGLSIIRQAGFFFGKPVTKDAVNIYGVDTRLPRMDIRNLSIRVRVVMLCLVHLL